MFTKFLKRFKFDFPLKKGGLGALTHKLSTKKPKYPFFRNTSFNLSIQGIYNVYSLILFKQTGLKLRF